MCHFYVFFLFLDVFGLRSGNQQLSHFISFLTGQTALFCGFTPFSICVPLFPSLQLSKLKRLLALQRESCRPSCPLIKQIVSTHTRTRTCTLTQTSLSGSGIWEGQVCVAAATHMPGDPWITAVQEGAESPNQTINSAPQRPTQFHLADKFTHRRVHTHKHTHSLPCTLVAQYL